MFQYFLLWIIKYIPYKIVLFYFGYSFGFSPHCEGTDQGEPHEIFMDIITPKNVLSVQHCFCCCPIDGFTSK